MSKSRGNVVNPDDMVKEYGADALRCYELFIGDYVMDAAWNENGLKGCKKFLDRIFRLGEKLNDSNDYSKETEILMNQTIKKVTVFDIYAGEKLGENLKSVAFRITMESDEVLTDEIITSKVNKIIKMAEFRYQAKLRS
jgi:leucyl-tRNA synthetase